MAPASVVITIVRHGETDHNAQKIIQGHLDTPLNAQGEAQALVVARYLRKEIAFDEVWSSDLSRANKTAEIIAREQRVPQEVRTDERIRERYLGALQGSKIGTIDRAAVANTIEPNAVLVKRLFSFWDSILDSASPSTQSGTESIPKQVLLVSHGGSIRALVAGLLSERKDSYVVLKEDEASLDNRVGNCSVTQFLVQQDVQGGAWKGRLLRYADDGHFMDSSRVPSPSENADVIE